MDDSFENNNSERLKNKNVIIILHYKMSKIQRKKIPKDVVDIIPNAIFLGE